MPVPSTPTKEQINARESEKDKLFMGAVNSLNSSNTFLNRRGVFLTAKIQRNTKRVKSLEMDRMKPGLTRKRAREIDTQRSHALSLIDGCTREYKEIIHTMERWEKKKKAKMAALKCEDADLYGSEDEAPATPLNGGGQKVKAEAPLPRHVVVVSPFVPPVIPSPLPDEGKSRQMYIPQRNGVPPSAYTAFGLSPPMPPFFPSVVPPSVDKDYKPSAAPHRSSIFPPASASLAEPPPAENSPLIPVQRVQARSFADYMAFIKGSKAGPEKDEEEKGN